MNRINYDIDYAIQRINLHLAGDVGNTFFVHRNLVDPIPIISDIVSEGVSFEAVEMAVRELEIEKQVLGYLVFWKIPEDLMGWGDERKSDRENS